jgi:hypothetical protein
MIRKIRVANIIKLFLLLLEHRPRCPQPSQKCTACSGLASSKSWLPVPPRNGIGWVVTMCPAQAWPRESRDCLSPEVGFMRVMIASPSGVRLGRVMTVSPARGWPRASHDCLSHPRMGSSESWLSIPPEDGLEQVMTVSPVRGWDRASHDCISLLLWSLLVAG